MKRSRIAVALFLLIAALVLFFSDDLLPNRDIPNAEYTENGEFPFEIHFIDVGQADCILIKCENEFMLIDAGESSDSQTVYSYLDKQGADVIKYLVMTHAHADHIGGIPAVFEHSRVKNVLAPFKDDDTKLFEKIETRLKERGLSVTVPVPGDVFLLGGASVEVVGPINESNDKNNMSLVLRVEYGKTSVLLTGDAEKSELGEIVNAGYYLGCDILKVGHHGSAVCLTDELMSRISPAYAVISVGTGNKYGHPTDEALSLLGSYGIPVLRTDKLGDIIFFGDGETLSYATTSSGDVYADTDQPATADYILNTSSRKFHSPDCSRISGIQDENYEEYFGSRDDLIGQGYTPCGICDP